MPDDKPIEKRLTPLWVIAAFVGLTETVVGIAATQSEGNVQLSLVIFVTAFPVLVAGGFFTCLFFRPFVFYAPSEYAGIDPRQFIDALKGGVLKAVRETSDVEGPVETVGRPDNFQLLFKAVGPTWARSTKAMQVRGGGCVVQVSTKFLTPRGDWNVAEAISYVPNAIIEGEADGAGRVLVARDSHQDDPSE